MTHGNTGHWAGHGGTALVERDREQKLLRDLLNGLRGGPSALVEIDGGPGSGRSALLNQAVTLAGRAGVRVVTAHASWEESALRYGIADQLLAALGRPDDAPPSDSDDAVIVEALCQVFLAAARVQPLLVAVDDTQWADPHSWRWLRSLARLLPDAPMMLLTTRCGVLADGTHDPLEPGSSATGRTVARHTLTPAPLSAAGVTELLTRAHGRPVDPAFGTAAAHAAGGNPTLLRTVAGRFARHDWPPAADHLPHLVDSVAEAFRERAARTAAALPAELLDVLRAIAVCGQDGTPDMIAALTESDGTDTARAVARLAGTGLLTDGDRPAFHEPRAAEAVLAGLGADRREQLYARAARHAHRAAVPDSGLTRMLLAAHVVGATWAVDALRREAARCRAVGDLRAAARLLHRALREPMAPASRAKVFVELSAVVLATSPAASDRHLRSVLLTRADASAGPSWVEAAGLLVTRGDVVSVQPLIARVLDHTDVNAQDRAALRALYWLAEHSQRGAEHELDRPAVAALPDLPAEPAEAGVAAWHCALRGQDIDRTRSLARTALAPAARDTTPPAAQLAACQALLLTGDFAEAQAALVAILVRAQRSGTRPTAGLALIVEAQAALHQGSPEAAVTSLDRAQHVMPPHCWHPMMAPAPAGLRALAHLALGDVATAERAVEGVRPAGAESGLAWAYLLYARGRVRLAGGQGGAALADLLECGRLLLARQVANPVLLPWRSAAAAAHGPAGRGGPAADLLAEERRLTRVWGAPDNIDQGLRYVAEVALRTVRTAKAPAVPPAAPSGRGLTVAELRVAIPAARGMTNRAIAAELSMPLRAVELHLAAAYRKLGITRRVELARALGPLGRKSR
ncbi:LuxR family transcriptional regulator [Streptomyces sp. NPDC051162]|uniref:LuxR family transcriptional regulator n=1 Tax=Streptomyces sp. NPDC051162 TaxID=3154747 RepID=UPI003418B44A